MNSNTVRILGVPFHRITMDGLIDEVREAVRCGRKIKLAFSNPEFVVEARSNLDMQDYLANVDYNVADGMGVVFASRLFKNALPERITGTDFVPRLVQLSAEEGITLYFLGAQPGVPEKAKSRLENSIPGCRIIGCRDGYFSPDEEDEIVAEINKLSPDVVMVCLGNPLQEAWISRNFGKLNTCVIFGNGGALDFASGSARRAPQWMQAAGLEWFFRLWQDLSWHRIARQTKLLRFAALVLKTAFLSRVLRLSSKGL